jgi:signal transduction histidine kinase
MTALLCQQEEDRTQAVLNYAHRLLVSKAETAIGDDALPGLLEELAKAYGAMGAGIVAPLDGPGMFKRQSWVAGASPPNLAYPWEKDARPLNQAGQALASVVVRENEDASWLLGEIAQPNYANFVLWVMDRSHRRWSRGERAGLPIVGQALTRLKGQGGTTWMRCLEKVRLQRALAQAVFVARRLAHDFGNYLTGILGFAELTAKHVPEGSLPQRYLKEVWQSAKDGASWVHKLQSLSQAKAPHFEPTDLAGVVREETDRLRPLCGDAVTLLTSLEEPLPRLDVGKEPLRQVVAQLLDNAREAIEGQGTITLAARTVQLGPADGEGLLGNPKPGAFVEITIGDTGMGITPEMHERLFADFFFTTKPRHRGLGLVTVYSIVQLYQGGVRLGPHPERGTLVSVFLPVARPSQDLTANGPPTNGAGELP